MRGQREIGGFLVKLCTKAYAQYRWTVWKILKPLCTITVQLTRQNSSPNRARLRATKKATANPRLRGLQEKRKKIKTERSEERLVTQNGVESNTYRWRSLLLRRLLLRKRSEAHRRPGLLGTCPHPSMKFVDFCQPAKRLENYPIPVKRKSYPILSWKKPAPFARSAK